MSYSINVRGVLLALALVPLITACGKEGGSATPTQVAARVNSDEITVHQVNQTLARAGRIPPEQMKTASRQAVEQLVDQQLLIQKAVEKKLDRDPDVMASLEASRRQILAQAYMEKSVLSGAPKATPEEVKKFYEARPELFSERRVYRLQELAIAAGADKQPALRELVEKSKNLNDVVTWLRANNLQFNANSAVRPAEQLPLEALPRLSKMKDGEMFAMQAEGRFTIVQLAASQAAPLTEKEATPQIEQFLMNQKRSQLAGAEMKQLRQVAKLSYEGEFAPVAGSADAAKGNDTAKAAATSAPAQATTPTSTGVGAPAAAESGFDKGLKGLR